MSRLRSWAFSWARRFARDQRGAVAVMVGLSATAFIGMTALAVEVGQWYETRRDMQVAADAAAVGGAEALRAGASTVLAQSEAWADSGANGYVVSSAKMNVGSGTNGLTVTVNLPPASGALSGNSSAVEVIVSQPQPLLLAKLFIASGPTISARAVAEVAGGPTCILALAPSGARSGQLTGGTTTLNNCNLQVNSTNSDAFNVTGGTFTATAEDVVGNYLESGGTLTPKPTVGVASVPDPYSGLYAANSVSALVSPACPSSNKNVNISSSKTIQPGTYCGLNVSGGTVTLAAGVYIIQGGKFSISGGQVTGTGVTIILTCGSPPCTSSSSSWATASLTAGITTLSAPTTGIWAGILFYQDPNDNPTNNDKDSLTGGSNALQGVLYFPTQAVDFTGGAAAISCLQIVSYTIEITGGTNIGSNCAGTGVVAFGSKGGGPVQLNE